MNKRRNVNIVVAGDPGVGKTSLILAAATEAFPDHPVPTLPPTSLPGELTPDGVPSTVVDTSSRPEDRPTLEEQCRKADVILLLWSKESSESLQRLREHWLPFLRLLGVSVPIVLVGARQDLAAQKEKHTLQQAITPLMTQFKEIEVCLECSAKKLQFVGDVFYYAIKAVVHPTAPLFDTYSNQLRPACSKALRRIFTLCDADRDGVLSDSELNAFQVHCWKTPLTPSELDGIKKVVADKMPAGVSNNGLTISGFVYLHSLFIQRGRIETTWAVLRSYGYDDDLTLKDEILDSVSFAASPDQVVELTDTAREFLGSCFQSCDQDRDGALSAHELELVFSTAPFNPWALPEWDRVLAETGSSGALTFKGFLAKWAYMTMKEPRTSLANILYLGYRGDPSQLFCLSKRRRQERKSDPGGRSILQCYVLGSRGAGKSTLVRGLVGIPAGAAADGAAHDHLAAVGTVDGPASEPQDGGDAGGPLRLCRQDARLEQPRGVRRVALCLRRGGLCV
uniref:Ras homolog gene family, member T1 n=1 Tax=Tetraselmis sp. GSL018 TaxID=582737 RepID=A0A061RX14_9CHLO